MNEEDVLKALQALAESDRDREAPADVEAKLRSAFRKRYKTRIWPYFAVAAAGAQTVAGVYRTRAIWRAGRDRHHPVIRRIVVFADRAADRPTAEALC